MEVAQFYLHLPSNSSLDKFSNNTLTEYRVCLPQTISLTGDWKVALTEIHYPHSWNNVQETVDLEHSFHDLYVYCDIIQSQYVGDALVPLL